MKNPHEAGFSLLQLSIALVIIGLITGGILTGQDLINAAAICSQISQIEKFNTAVGTFQGKYNYLPGDIPNPAATQYGFQSRGQHDGEGDGNGKIEGNCGDTNGSANGYQTACGELAVFWQDLSTAQLIDTAITTGANSPQFTGAPWPPLKATTTPALKDWLPTAKIGQNNYIYIYNPDKSTGINYFAVSSVTQLDWAIRSTAAPGLTVQQAYAVDSKIDDGLPQSGDVTACYLNRNVQNYGNIWASGGLITGVGGTISNGNNCIPTTVATPPLNTDCYGNNNTAGTMQYSISTNANTANCALSFQFQTQ